MTDYLRCGSKLPAYMAYPRFLLKMEISETAKLVYILLLDRARVSMKNKGWADEKGLLFVCYTIESLVEATGKSATTIKNALKALEDEKLILRRNQGAGKPSRIFVRVETENCLPDGQIPVSGPDRKPSGNNKHSNNKGNRIRNYDYEEGESL